MIEDPKPGMRVRDPNSKTKAIHVIDKIRAKGKYADQYAVLKINQWFTKEHLGTLKDDWEVVK